MKRLALALLAVLLAATTAMAQPKSLDSLLQPYLKRYNLPALAAAVVKDGQIVAAGAVGTVCCQTLWDR